MSFQIAGKVFQVALFVPFRITLWGIHIAFSVHDFIISPVDDRTTCNAYLEYLGIAEQQCRSHVTTETPAVHTDAVAIYIRQTFQEFHTFHLVFSFFNAKMSESSIFKFQSAVVTSTVVEAEHDVTFVGHVDIPATCTVLPTAGDHLGVRSTVYIDNGGVFLIRIKVRRFYETIVKISHTVGSFDGAYFDAWHGEVLEWIFCCQQIDAFPVLCGDKVDAAWHFRAGIGIYEVTAACTQCAVVYTFRCA